MKEFYGKTFSELTTAEPLDIRGLGDTPLTICQLRNVLQTYSYESGHRRKKEPAAYRPLAPKL